MRVLALFVSLLFGAAVLVLFLKPWDGASTRREGVATRPEAVAVAEPKPIQPIEAAPQQAAPQASQAARPDPKPTLLASEKAEAERNAALKGEQKHAIAPDPLTKRYFKVKVRDAGTLEVDVPNADALVIRLDGIEAREADESCTKENGTVWPCGAKARAALTLFIRSRAVSCTLPPSGEAGEFAAQCSVMNQDLATWLVRRGWATPKNSAEGELAKALQAAKAERIGLWGAE